MARPGVSQVPEGSGEQGKIEEAGCNIICGAPTILAVTGKMRWYFPDILVCDQSAIKFLSLSLSLSLSLANLGEHISKVCQNFGNIHILYSF